MKHKIAHLILAGLFMSPLTINAGLKKFQMKALGNMTLKEVSDKLAQAGDIPTKTLVDFLAQSKEMSEQTKDVVTMFTSSTIALVSILSTFALARCTINCCSHLMDGPFSFVVNSFLATIYGIGTAFTGACAIATGLACMLHIKKMMLEN